MSDELVSETYELKFSTAGEKYQKEIVDADSSEEAYQQAREELCESLNLSKTEFEKQFSSTLKTYCKYVNKPWNSWEELESFFTNLDGVSSFRYQAPLEGAYGPPTYYIHTEPGYEKEIIADRIKEYYAGLIVEIEVPITVTISPVRFREQ